MARSESTSDRNRGCRGFGDAIIEKEVASGEFQKKSKRDSSLRLIS